MNEIMTSAGRMSKADAARMRFAKHYEIMRKYHTQVNRIKNGNIAKNNKPEEQECGLIQREIYTRHTLLLIIRKCI